MEPAGLALGAVGLLGLFSLYQEAVSVVGVADRDSLEKNAHPELKDPAVVAAVSSLLASICDVFAAVDPTLTRHDQASASSAGNPSRKKFRSRLNWALADNDKLTLQAQDFVNLVQKLYHLVPPERLQPDEFQKLQEALIQSQRSEALRRVSQWLDATTTENNFDAYCSTRLDTTCGWIDAHPAYQHWLTEQPGKALKVLWVHGPAGFGKSVLCAYIINSLLDNDSDAQRNPSAIPRSWVHQAYLGKCDNTKATHSDILRLFKNIATPTHKSELIFVVDGPDECPRTNTARVELHRNRADILWEITKEAAGTGARLLVLRPHGPQPPGVHFDEVNISRDDVSLDVARFAEHIVTQKLQGNTQQFCQDLATQMAKNSDGMFLLIRLQSQTLRPRKGKNQLRRAVSEMPTNLAQVYERHWDDIRRLPPSDRQRAEAILRWVLFARHPLRILELSEIVTVLDTDEGDEPQFDDLPASFDEEFVDDEILGLCGSFLELRDPAVEAKFADKTVHLIHFSASEFLLGQHACAQFYNTMLQEYYLAQTCLRYLDCPGTWERQADEDSDSIHDRPFAFYAVYYWFEHVAACVDSEYDIKDLFEAPSSESSEDGDSEEANSEDNSPEESESGEGHSKTMNSKAGESPGGRTYYAAQFGLRDVLQYMHESGSIDISDTPKYYRDPLQAAAFRGNLDALTFLLEIGANPEAEGLFGSSLLAPAAASEEEAVTVLLHHGASVSATSTTGQTPLHLAAQKGHYFIAQQLLNHNSDLSAADNDGRTPLMAAAYYGHIKMVRLLVEKGSLGSDDIYEYNALIWAAINGHVEAVQRLLDSGAEVNHCTRHGETALSFASEKGHTGIVKTLLNFGASTETPDKDGYRPSLLAAENDSGASPDAASSQGLTPLIAAAWKGHSEAVKTLLDSGASLEASYSDGWTPLHFAAANGHLDVIRILLESGNHVTPIHVGAERGRVEVVQMLLEAGVDVNISAEDGSTPLHCAVRGNDRAVVELLLHHHASLDQLDLFGRTAFEYTNDDTIAGFRGRFSECEHYAHPTEDARQQRVRESVSLLAGRVKALEKKKMTLLDILGRCLLQLNYKLDAAIVFSETTHVDSESESLDHNISCDLCDEYVFGERWICTSCRSENLCAACMTKSLADVSERLFCSGHEYFCVVEGDGGVPKTNVYTEEFVAWLKELEIRHGLATL
ncbi:hypothetical protein BJY01DRAFT_263070 [Aspergillus pseudoustus]|uniref:Nephrocystin 3-like N-terminal domain-containing protein n=1 Tax=Aspergillus pseudoustus TaxID=1810923 RepID=A0ABR4K7H1_9EURO